MSFKELLQPFFSNDSLGEFSLLRPYKATDREILSLMAERKVDDPREKVILQSPQDYFMYIIASDCYRSVIEGSCALHDGTILVVDSSNSCLKRVSLDTKLVTDCVQFCFKPYSACVINHQEVAVTLPSRKRVQIVSIEDKMGVVKQFDVGIKCHAIAHHEGTFYISDKDTVYMYREARTQCEWSFYGGFVHNLAVSPCSGVLYVPAKWHGLIAVDTKSGRDMWQYTADDLQVATAVCADGLGRVFVCGLGYDRPTVLQFSERGVKIRQTLLQEDGITGSPLSVCVDSRSKTLVVTQGKAEYACMWKLDNM